MIDDRDFSWMGRPAPAPPTYAERLLWRVAKDTRWTEARVRDVPHGSELRFMVMDEGREEQLMHSVVFKTIERTELGKWSAGVLRDFVRLGWLLQNESVQT